MSNNDNLTIEKLRAAVAALGPKPPTFEIWALKHFPRFDDTGKPTILKVAASELDTIWQSVTGAEFIIMCNPLTFTGMEVLFLREKAEAGLFGYVEMGIPVFSDEQLREHWVKLRTMMVNPRHPLFFAPYWESD